MNTWNCCRTCLGETSLNPILPNLTRILEVNNKNNEALLLDGLKIQIEDKLPQEMCTPCMDTINKFIKFQQNCEYSYNILLERLKKKQFSNVPMETNKKNLTRKVKTKSSIEITDFIDKSFDEIELDSDGIADEHDYCDNIDDPTDDDVKNETIEFEATIEEILKKHKPFKLENLPNNFISNAKIKSEGTDANVNTENGTREFNIEVKVEEMQSKNESVPEKVTDDILEPYECQTCHKVYKNKFSYVSHRKIHDGLKVVCEHCGKSFLDRRRLLMHCKAKHGYQKTDKCSFCDYTGASKEAVKIHERLHTGEKPYVCEVCSASFHRKSSYLQHKPIHLQEKTVPCDLCPALFKSITLMRIHKTKHKPREYKHKCLICGTNFGKRWHCLRHLQRIHGVSEALDSHLERVRLNDIEK